MFKIEIPMPSSWSATEIQWFMGAWDGIVAANEHGLILTIPPAVWSGDDRASFVKGMSDVSLGKAKIIFKELTPA